MGNVCDVWAYLIHLSTNMWKQHQDAGFSRQLTTEDETWDEIIDFLPSQGFNTVVIDVGDGMQYESHPEISVAGAWPKDKMKNKLDHIRSLGMTPIPKLNFSAGHDGWLGIYSYMISTPEYYRVCSDLIREVAELFGNPALFHLGMDEETAGNQAAYGLVRVRQKDLLWRDMNYLFNLCDQVGARPWVWSDHCCRNREDFLKNMSRSVLQSNWYYGKIFRNPDGTYPDRDIEVFEILDKAGFDQVLTCSVVFGNTKCAEQVMQLAKDVLTPEQVKGFIATPWYMTESTELYAHLHEAHRFGAARQKVFP